MCFNRQGRLPWADNTAMGHAPKWAPGGEMSHRLSNGQRMNQWGHAFDSGATVTGKDEKVRSKGFRPSHRQRTNTKANGEMEAQNYGPPVLANPGNLIHLNVGGGCMGSPLAHENEAPFPEKLAEWFVRSCCPEGGIVLDPFIGSGTTAAVCVQWNRRCVGVDIRESQIELSARRIPNRPLLAI